MQDEKSARAVIFLGHQILTNWMLTNIFGFQIVCQKITEINYGWLNVKIIMTNYINF